MNELIIFNSEVTKQLGAKFKEHNWSGVCPQFYKRDIPNLIKCIEIRKSLDQDNFNVFVSIYANFSSSRSRIKQMLHTSNQIFLVGLTPKGVSNTAYAWPIAPYDDQPTQFNSLWESIAVHATAFFDRFANFPEEFLAIKPDDFKRGSLKLFNTYEVYNQVIYMNFLKEIHIALNHNELAAAFSELAIDRFHKNVKGKKHIQSKAYLKEYKKFLRGLEMPK